MLKNLLSKLKKKYPITQIKQKKIKVKINQSKLKSKEIKIKVAKRRGKSITKNLDKVSEECLKKEKQRSKTVKELYKEANKDFFESSGIALNFRKNEDDLNVTVKKTNKNLENKTKQFTIKEIFQNLNQNSCEVISTSNNKLEEASKISEKSNTEISNEISLKKSNK